MKIKICILTLNLLFCITYNTLSQWEWLSKYDGTYLYLTSSNKYCIEYIDNILWVGAGNLWFSTNFGSTWDRISYSSVVNVNGMIKFKNNLFAGGLKGNAISENQGKNWKLYNNGLPASDLQNYVVIKDSLIFCSMGAGVYYSKDFGINWEKRSNGMTLGVNCIITKGDTLIASSNDNGVYFSTDYGENWMSKNYGICSSGVLNVNVLNDNIYAATFGGGLCLSTNSGDSWRNISGDSLPSNVRCVLPYKGVIFSGTDNGLYVSTNEGLNWKRKDPQKNTQLFTKLFILDNYLYCGVGKNSGVWKCNIDYLTGVKNEPDWEYAGNIYPNPASNFVRIETDFLENPKLEVYGILGNQVNIPCSHSYLNNKLISELNTSQLPTSTYFYVITNGTKNYTGRFIKE